MNTMNAQTALDQIHAASKSPAQDTRTLRRSEPGTVAAHQGDIYVHCVKPGSVKAGKPWGSGRQVAVGHNKGSRHVAEGNVKVFEIEDAREVADRLLPCMDARARTECLGPVVVAEESWTLTHPEHAHHVLPAGTYVVTYQLDAATMRRVQD